jgi:hypothetical protein
VIGPRFLREDEVTLAPVGDTRTITVTAVQKGIPLPALHRLLDHGRLTTTEIYLNFAPEEVVWEFREKW